MLERRVTGAEGEPARTLHEGWRRLWEAPAPYGLAHVVTHGARGAGVVVAPLQIALGATAAIPLVHDSQHGYVSISLGESRVAGLDSMTGQLLDCDEPSGTFHARIAIPSLRCEGDCSLTAAQGLEAPARTGGGGTLERALATAGGPAGGEEAESIALAERYRDQLATSANGLSLLGLYYRHNDTLDEVLSEANAFTAAWRLAHPTGSGRTTSYYAGITSQAAQQPGEQATGFNEADYQRHGWYMQVILLRTVEDLGPSSSDPAAYKALAEDISTMGDEAHQALGASTVGGVMQAVEAAPAGPGDTAEERLAMAAGRPGDVRAATPEHAAVAAAAREQAHADYAHWRRTAHDEREQRAADSPAATTGAGRWHVDLPAAAIELHGTHGPPGSVGATPHVASTHVVVGSAVPQLVGGGPLARAAAAALDGAVWLHDVIARRVRDALAGPAVRAYLSDRLAQSAALALGPLPVDPTQRGPPQP